MTDRIRVSFDHIVWEAPGDEYTIVNPDEMRLLLALVRLTPEARLEWRLSGETPRIISTKDPRVAEVVEQLRRGHGPEERFAFWTKLDRLNGRLR